MGGGVGGDILKAVGALAAVAATYGAAAPALGGAVAGGEAAGEGAAIGAGEGAAIGTGEGAGIGSTIGTAGSVAGALGSDAIVAQALADAGVNPQQIPRPGTSPMRPGYHPNVPLTAPTPRAIGPVAYQPQTPGQQSMGPFAQALMMDAQLAGQMGQNAGGGVSPFPAPQQMTPSVNLPARIGGGMQLQPLSPIMFQGGQGPISPEFLAMLMRQRGGGI